MRHTCGADTEVTETRIVKGTGSQKRRRQCKVCRVRFTTYELTEEQMARYQAMEVVVVGIKKLIT